MLGFLDLDVRSWVMHPCIQCTHCIKPDLQSHECCQQAPTASRTARPHKVQCRSNEGSNPWESQQASGMIYTVCTQQWDSMYGEQSSIHQRPMCETKVCRLHGGASPLFRLQYALYTESLTQKASLAMSVLQADALGCVAAALVR